MSLSPLPYPEQVALIHVMVLISAADGEMTDPELAMIGNLCQTLPVFDDFPVDRLPEIASTAPELLFHAADLEDALREVVGSLSPVLRETAYVLACDIAAADTGQANDEVGRVLHLLRRALGLDRLIGSAIERAARARYRRLTH